jgi:phosphoribosylanthranilate isomerase
MTFIKFCGLTRREDVAVAAELGVDAVGFVFWPGSPRVIAMDDAAHLINLVPTSIAPVGLFVKPDREEIVRAVEATGIRAAQVHGLTDVSTLSDLPCELWVATSLRDEAHVAPTDAPILLDAHDAQRYGGTGQTIDWEAAGVIAARRRVILAGGLAPDNVRVAIRLARPYGVDVSTGIEERPGIKSEKLMRAFAESVRREDRQARNVDSV